MLAVTCPQRDARSVSPRPVHPKDHAALLKSKADVMLWETARPSVALLRLLLNAECFQIILIEQAGMICGLHAVYGLCLYLDCLQHLHALPKQIYKNQQKTNMPESYASTLVMSIRWYHMLLEKQPSDFIWKVR